MDEELDRTPRAIDVLHASEHHRAEFRAAFGSWRAVVREALGRTVEPTREELLAAIVELHNTVEPDPTIETWREETLYEPRDVYGCPDFDGWTDAKQQAGILIGHRTIFGDGG